MWLLIAQPILISIIIIFLVHNLIIYFRDTYTTKKTKDVVGFHIQKYKTIMNELQETNEKERQLLVKKVSDAEKIIAKSTIETIQANDKTNLSEKDLKSMNDDLTAFIQTLQ